jgi:Tfp pilus assembly protein PilZ
VARDDPWCAVCCTRHGPRGACPGNLLATGPERHAHKFAVAHADGRLEYLGVLIAESGDLWRARLFTYPDMLWSVPGGRGTVKFVGATAREAGALAIEFLREHCATRRATMQEALVEPPVGVVDQENADRLAPKSGREERHPCKVPVRFGEDKATQAATTANLSAGGVYVATDKPLGKDRPIRMLLEVRQYTIPLVGTVAWVRRKEEAGKPRGMGVRLQHPPALYQRYVEEVQEKRTRVQSGGDTAKPG